MLQVNNRVNQSVHGSSKLPTYTCTRVVNRGSNETEATLPLKYNTIRLYEAPLLGDETEECQLYIAQDMLLLSDGRNDDTEQKMKVTYTNVGLPLPAGAMLLAHHEGQSVELHSASHHSLKHTGVFVFGHEREHGDDTHQQA